MIMPSTKKINAPLPDLNVAIKDRHFFFALKFKFLIRHFNFHGSLIDHFLKTITKR